MADSRAQMVETIAAMQDFALYRELAWEGSFEDYLQIVPQTNRRSRATRSSASTT
jgi:serine protein kinase